MEILERKETFRRTKRVRRRDKIPWHLVKLIEDDPRGTREQRNQSSEERSRERNILLADCIQKKKLGKRIDSYQVILKWRVRDRSIAEK